MKRQKSPLVQYILLGVLFAVACAYQARATIASFPGFLEKGSAAWPFLVGYSHGQPTAVFVRPEARAAGVHEGDAVTRVNGRPLTGKAVFGEATRMAKPGDQLRVTVRNPDSAAEWDATIRLGAASEQLNWAWALVVMLKVVMPVFSIALAFWVAFVRPRDIAAWLLLGVLLGLSNLFSAGTESWGRGIRDLGTLCYMAANQLWPICMLYFGLYFPEPFPARRARIWVWFAKRILGPLLLVNAVVQTVIAVGQVENYASVARLDAVWQRFSQLWFFLSLAAIGSFFINISTKASMVTSADTKRRLRLLYAGTTVSMLPTFLLIVIARFKGGGELEQVFPELLVLGSLALMLLFPITLAYVIVVQRALDVRVVVRQGLQYALATGAIRVFQVLLSAAVLTTGITLARNRHLTLAKDIAAVTALILTVLLLRRGALKLRAWTDRRFFRDAYNAEQILTSLGDEVRSIVETRTLIERVSTKIAESLHIPRIAVLLPQDGFYRPAYAFGYGSVPQAEFRDAATTIERLRREAEPARVYFEDEGSWVNAELPEGERRELATLDPRLLLPLSVKDKLLGVLSLGEKRSEEPYSGTDLRLLKSVAAQTGLALANAQLTTAIAEEVARRQKMSCELEIAREVQERLFPQRRPEVVGLDYCGKCRTALGVGGDYYDFLALPDGKLGIALGDVSGKGIAAALMMASLEASLRAEASRAGSNLAAMIGRVNQMLFDASSEDRYATLFYALYDPATRLLTYVNAGHNAPMLFRQRGNVERLDEGGGPVVGLLPECAYEQAEASLGPGDMLLMYTDGITEALDPTLEEWGEKRLIAAASALRCRSSEDVVAGIVQAADAHAAGASQSDDMTLVVLRVIEH